MTADDATAPSEIEDLRPPDHWGRHLLTKIVLFGALGVGIAGARFVGGDGGTLLMGAAGVVVWSFGLIAAIEQMRGLVSPLPGRDMKLLSPIAGMAWAAGFLVMSIMVLSTVAFEVNDGERPGWLVALGAVGIALLVLGFMIQIGSLSDQWPDKWRPPYARQQRADAGAPGADPDDGPADRTPDRA
jgi:hypothetical protein